MQIKNKKQFSNLARNLKFLAFDFDGVFTDGKVIVNEDGSESVVCSRRDTLRLTELKKSGIELAIISKETNKVVTTRARKMDIPAIGNVHDKLSALKKLLKEKNLIAGQAGFVGDDINDLACLAYSGIAFTTADADIQCKKMSLAITSHTGGNGAVREICDVLLKIRGIKKS